MAKYPCFYVDGKYTSPLSVLRRRIMGFFLFFHPPTYSFPIPPATSLIRKGRNSSVVAKVKRRCSEGEALPMPGHIG